MYRAPSARLRAGVDRRVRRDRLPPGAAEQLVDGPAELLADEVVQGDVDGRERVDAEATPAVVDRRLVELVVERRRARTGRARRASGQPSAPAVDVLHVTSSRTADGRAHRPRRCRRGRPRRGPDTVSLEPSRSLAVAGHTQHDRLDLRDGQAPLMPQAERSRRGRRAARRRRAARAAHRRPRRRARRGVCAPLSAAAAGTRRGDEHTGDLSGRNVPGDRLRHACLSRHVLEPDPGRSLMRRPAGRRGAASTSRRVYGCLGSQQRSTAPCSQTHPARARARGRRRSRRRRGRAR